MKTSFRWNRSAAMMTVVIALFFLTIGAAPALQQALPALDQSLDPLRTRFNQDVGKVRLIVIVDPTCPPCRWGASEIEKEVLERVHSDRLAVYVIWIPVLNFQDQATLQKNGLKESVRVSDSRATHYIDPNGFSGKQYSPILKIPYHSPAWDVYLAFGPGVRWEDRAPVPTSWMYQGDGLEGGRRLDGPKFAEVVQQLLAASGAKSGAR
jgi:hypothetical protein